MDFSKLEQLDKHIHIISALEKAASFGGHIWQTGTSGGREVFQIVQMQVDSLQGKIILRTNSLTMVEPDYQIFVRLRYRNIIFKLDPNEYKVIDDKIHCPIPLDVKALAKRPNDRYVLPVEQNVSLSVKRLGRAIREISPVLEVRIIDVSETGIGILISGANREFFKPYDHFWVKAIDNKPLTKEIFGTVLYVSPKGYYLKKSDVRIGLSLKTPLSWDTLADLKKKCKVVLTA